MQFDVLNAVYVNRLGRTRVERDVRNILGERSLDLREPVRPNGRVAGAGFISNPLVDLGVVVEGTFRLGTGNPHEGRDVVVGVEVVRVPSEEEHRHPLVDPVLFVDGPNVGLEGNLEPATRREAVLEGYCDRDCGAPVMVAVVVPELNRYLRWVRFWNYGVGTDRNQR